MARRLLIAFSSRNVIYASIVGDLLVAGTKLIAAFLTGSSAMVSEAVHSVVDSGNSMLLLYGLHRGGRPPDRSHPLGYGREIYFWSFVVALLVFALGAGVSLFEGVLHVLHPEPIRNPGVNYVVLAISALLDGTTFLIAMRSFKARIRLVSIFEAVRQSKDPPSFMVIIEDGAALIGIAFAFLGTFLSVRLDLPVLDGVASILIGLLLAGTAALLARETKGLLIGEAADSTLVDSILKIANDMEGVAHANGIITTHLAPRQIVAALSLEFADDLRTPEIEAKVTEFECRVRACQPAVIAVFVKPQSSRGYSEAMAMRYGPKDFSR